MTQCGISLANLRPQRQVLERSVAMKELRVHQTKTNFLKTIGGLLASLVLSSGCGKSLHLPTRDTGQFEEYVKRFETYATEHNKSIAITDIKIQFGELNPSEYGRCIFTFGNTPQIVISEKRWDLELDEDRREALIFHELGHCILKRPHDDQVQSYVQLENVKLSIPGSLMCTYLLGSDIYKENKNYYMKELFNPEFLKL